MSIQVHVRGEPSPIFTKVTQAGERTGELIFHSHLLPNGSVDLVFKAFDGGKLVGKRTFTIQVRNQGEVAEMVRQSLQARGAPTVFEGPCDSSAYDYADPKLTAWFDRDASAVQAHVDGLIAAGRASQAEGEILRHFAEQGFAILENVIEPELLERLNASLDDAISRKVEGYEYGSSQRMHNLHERYPAVRELWMHPKVMRMLELIFGVPASPCQSLTYVFGSQQEHHQDLVHLTPFPAGRMCGVWTALEDVQPDSGELVVFPGSHRTPRIYMHTAGAPKVRDNDWTAFGEKVVPMWMNTLAKGGFERFVYRPKAGTVLIWHENLMHGGQPRVDLTKSRRSIVGHYFAQGAVVYYDSSGLPGSVHDVAAARAGAR
ncbi:hypothetical protein DJ018_09855 [Phenylobacterium deserti]|uniref:Phytanoyl-CoA dioxygenase n=1 Tax=Phenylobacterium deserti TaxID=1914756 RepID=A0A328ACW6_9CAUL|nr:hypothetical protein DJ018_09855 [Phenylobacterium deserti]